MRRLNPGYKFLTLLMVSVILAFTYHVALNMAITALALAALLLTPGVNKKRMLMGILPFFAMAAGLFMTGLLFPAGGRITGSWGVAAMSVQSLEGAMQLASRVLAFGSIGLLFALTTDAVAFVMSLMQQFHLPPKFAYGLLAAYHFFPVVREEYGIVRAAFKVRGIKPPLLSPRGLTPMLVHAFERSESIAMAMESRGFNGDAPRTVAFPVAVGRWDYLFLLGCTALTLAAAIAL